MQSKKSTIILLICFFIGLSVLLYPSISSYWNSKHRTQAIIDYEGMLSRIKAEDYTAFFDAADEYNTNLAALKIPMIEYKTLEGYEDILNVSGNGMIGYVIIPKISQELPVYHGTSDAVLAVAVGHMEGTSLPVGGANTHAVVSAHRGLPTAELFTYLDRMEIGDTFYFKILDREITYEVDQIRIVEPDDLSLIHIEQGGDYCTLLTCTPYGINTQRLLVRGCRSDSIIKRNIYIANEAYRIDTLVVMPVVALPIIVLLMIYVMFAPVKKESLGEEEL